MASIWGEEAILCHLTGVIPIFNYFWYQIHLHKEGFTITSDMGSRVKYHEIFLLLYVSLKF